MKDYYYILGVSRNASEDEIKKAYRKLSMKFHPDQNNNDKYWEERFKDINEAYETLVDYSRRRMYDERFEQESSGQNFTASAASPSSPSSPPKPSVLKRLVNVVLNIIWIIIVIGALVRVSKGCGSSNNSEKASSESTTEHPSKVLAFTRAKTRFYNKTLKVWSDWSSDWSYTKKPFKFIVTQLDDQSSKFKFANFDSTASYDVYTFRGYDSKNDWNEYVAESGEEIDVRHATLNSVILNGMEDNIEFYIWDYPQDIAYELQ